MGACVWWEGVCECVLMIDSVNINHHVCMYLEIHLTDNTVQYNTVHRHLHIFHLFSNECLLYGLFPLVLHWFHWRHWETLTSPGAQQQPTAREATLGRH